MLYTVRKNKSRTGNIITFKQSFYKLIRDDNGWVIRVYLHVLKEKIGEFKSNLTFDLDSSKRINEVIEKNGDHYFDEPLLHYISEVFIDGIAKSTIKDPDMLYLMIKTFFVKITMNNL
ncbi:hypothetical protein OI70_21555 [Dickeya fangzhongdai]|uniref:hypothetical protein n=1 Tax=Dickeya fangzhongdai TaxID=1778540 RepID=UPI000575BED9|nr:hypothetical protein [Dickeya fangzhongdai]KHN50879.1 hypothetical protein OI70_21555 [Dickeya fangzhongdai]